MEDIYIKPVRYSVLYSYQVQQQQPNPQGGSNLMVANGVYINNIDIDWKHIAAIESFSTDHPNEFPNYPNSNKFRVIVPWGNYICIGSFNEATKEWGEYKVWTYNNQKEDSKINFNLGKAN